MLKFVLLPLLILIGTSATLYADDKESSLEKAIKDIGSDDDHPGKGKGRPDNPGEHGRENAAEKQSRGQGNGSKKNDSWEDRLKEYEGSADDKNDKKNDKKK